MGAGDDEPALAFALPTSLILVATLSFSRFRNVTPYFFRVCDFFEPLIFFSDSIFARRCASFQSAGIFAIPCLIFLSASSSSALRAANRSGGKSDGEPRTPSDGICLCFGVPRGGRPGIPVRTGAEEEEVKAEDDATFVCEGAVLKDGLGMITDDPESVREGETRVASADESSSGSPQTCLSTW